MASERNEPFQNGDSPARIHQIDRWSDRSRNWQLRNVIDELQFDPFDLSITSRHDDNGSSNGSYNRLWRNRRADKSMCKYVTRLVQEKEEDEEEEEEEEEEERYERGCCLVVPIKVETIQVQRDKMADVELPQRKAPSLSFLGMAHIHQDYDEGRGSGGERVGGMTLKGRCCCWRRKKGESLTGEQSLAPEVQRSRRQERARTHVRTSREEDGRLVSSTSVGPASRDSHNHHPRVHRARARNSLTGMEGGGLLPSLC
ncbi:hypothetical protein V1478_018701 [Vespula squamosa]|uniref:Uncharacterized protein n=1 Tax=Vespula squamosa TaxID=30214 RepID=A0ABD1ZVZ6_VESSQ